MASSLLLSQTTEFLPAFRCGINLEVAHEQFIALQKQKSITERQLLVSLVSWKLSRRPATRLAELCSQDFAALLVKHDLENVFCYDTVHANNPLKIQLALADYRKKYEHAFFDCLGRKETKVFWQVCQQEIKKTQRTSHFQWLRDWWRALLNDQRF